MRKSLHSAAACSRRGGILSGLFIVILIAIGLGSGGYWYWKQSQTSTQLNDLIVAEASRGPFDHIVLEQGELESTSNVDIVCQVRARGGSQGTAILWVVDEGAVVKPGDKLVELDSSALETALKEKRIVVISAEAGVAAAEALVEQAKISRQEYLEGLFQTEERAIQSEMAIAEQGLRKAQLALESTERLVAKGLVKSLQLEADQFAVANNRNLLEGAESRLKVLQNLTRQKMLVQFDSAIDSAEAQLAAALGALEEEQADLRDIQQQIELCHITAPSGGVVIHANSYSSRGGNAEFVVEPGAVIRERQTILRLPDPTKMQVRAKVNESRITLIRQGMPAKIRVDAINNMELLGRVSKVNRYAEPGSWFSSSIKEYATIIEIIDPPDTIRTGMTAEVQIFVEQLPEAVQVPIQAIYEHGGKTYSLIRQNGKDFETREVSIGASNDKFVTIQSGIEPGENVVLNLRQNLTLMDLPTITQEDNAALAALSTEGELASTVDGPSEREGRPEGRGPGGRAQGDGPSERGEGVGPRGEAARQRPDGAPGRRHGAEGGPRRSGGLNDSTSADSEPAGDDRPTLAANAAREKASAPTVTPVASSGSEGSE
ncbi:MAG: efflux RND transporter periplasmic adaptor subunit [Planctomycetaceae bacterium]